MTTARDLKGLPAAYGGCTCSCHRVPGVMHVAPCCKPVAAGEHDFPPTRLWLSAGDADNEHQVWFGPGEGGTPYILADMTVQFHSVQNDLAAEFKRSEAMVERIIDAVMGADRYAPKIVPMGANPPLFDGMQIDHDGPWVSRVEVAKILRAALSNATSKADGGQDERY
jgi:hypothetical protein